MAKKKVNLQPLNNETVIEIFIQTFFIKSINYMLIGLIYAFSKFVELIIYDYVPNIKKMQIFDELIMTLGMLFILVIIIILMFFETRDLRLISINNYISKKHKCAYYGALVFTIALLHQPVNNADSIGFAELILFTQIVAIALVAAFSKFSVEVSYIYSIKLILDTLLRTKVFIQQNKEIYYKHTIHGRNYFVRTKVLKLKYIFLIYVVLIALVFCAAIYHSPIKGLAFWCLIIIGLVDMVVSRKMFINANNDALKCLLIQNTLFVEVLLILTSTLLNIWVVHSEIYIISALIIIIGVVKMFLYLTIKYAEEKYLYTSSSSIVRFKTDLLIEIDTKDDALSDQVWNALLENTGHRAILLHGQWGSGKTYYLHKLLNSNFKEVDLLKFGSGENKFYATFKALTSPYKIDNIKINLINLVSDPSLIKVIIITNVTFIPLLLLLKDVLLTGPTDQVNSYSLLFKLVFLLNLIAVAFLPYITMEKDVNSNKHRKLYLDLICNSCSYTDIVVFENLDRLDWNEINDVLEVINHLNERQKNVVVPADLDYIKFESKFYVKGDESSKKYQSLYFNRYFKEVIKIPSEAEAKCTKMKSMFKEKNEFIAKYEWHYIKEIIEKHAPKIDARELEGYIEKYISKPRFNQFSYELFLYLNSVEPYGVVRLDTLDNQVIENWIYLTGGVEEAHKELLNNRDVTFEGNRRFLSARNVTYADLISERYEYAYMPHVLGMGRGTQYCHNSISESKIISTFDDSLYKIANNALSEATAGNDYRIKKAINELTIGHKIQDYQYLSVVDRVQINDQIELDISDIVNTLQEKYNIDISPEVVDKLLCVQYIKDAMKYNY